MTNDSARGLLSISVDLELDTQRCSTVQHRALASMTQRLVELFDRYEVAVTWAVADPTLSAATDQIVGARVEHELAILGDRGWIGPEAGRKRFARELSRRVVSSRASGMSVTTLALRDTSIDEHLDLVIKHGISAIRSRITPSQPIRACDPRMRRFGLWEFASSAVLPGRGWSIRRGLSRAAARGRRFLLTMDVGRLCGTGAAPERSIERVLRWAVACRDRDQLIVQTLAQSAESLLKPCAVRPARSILRPAA